MMVRKLLLSTLFCLVNLVYCSQEPQKQVITSDKVYVDETATDSLIAKQNAMKSALKKAIIYVENKYKIKLNRNDLHYSFTVLKEKFTDVRYQAILQFSFTVNDIQNEEVTAGDPDKESRDNVSLPRESITITIPLSGIKDWINGISDEIRQILGVEYYVSEISNDRVTIKVGMDKEAFRARIADLRLENKLEETGSSFTLRI